MKFYQKNPIGTILISFYLLTTLAFGIYALMCDSEWCSLVLVIPLTPWPQLEGFLPFSIPQFFLPAGVIINSFILFFIGQIIQKFRNH